MRSRAVRLVWYWGPLAVYAATIYYLSSLSHPPVPPLHFANADKVLHFIEYAVFGLLLCRGLAAGGRGLTARKAIAAAAIAGAIYGALDEIHQSFVPERDADPFDWLTDLVGSTAGAVTYWRVRLARRRARAARAAAPVESERATGG